MTEMIRVITGDGLRPCLASYRRIILSLSRSSGEWSRTRSPLSASLDFSSARWTAEEEAAIGRQFHLPAKKKEFSVLGADTNDNTKAAAG